MPHRQSRVAIGRLKKVKVDAENRVGPRGTFFYTNKLANEQFPLPAAGNGHAPCFCLIGRIGHGPVFFVGAERSWVAEQTGRLWLGINDFDVAANTGAFYAQVTRPPDVQPASFRQELPLPPEGAEPLPTSPPALSHITP